MIYPSLAALLSYRRGKWRSYARPAFLALDPLGLRFGTPPQTLRETRSLVERLQNLETAAEILELTLVLRWRHRLQ